MKYLIIAVAILSKIALILIWRKIPLEKRTNLIDNLKRTFGHYDSRGLKYSITHLEQIEKQIPFWDLSKQAQYRDRVCEHSVLHELEHECVKISEKPHFPTFNSTSVGNLAFVALYSLNKEYRIWALNVLTQYRIWLQR